MSLADSNIISSNNNEFYPKVLVVGESFHTRSGGGITQSNLFKFWPKDKIAIIPYEKGTSDPSVCSRIYNLSEIEIKYPFPFKLINKISEKVRNSGKESSSQVKHNRSHEGHESHDTDGEANDQHTRILYLKKTKIRLYEFMRGIYRAIIGFFGISHVTNRMVVSSELLKWIDEFTPNVIYAQFATVDKIRFVHDLKISTGLPLVLHFMDDWPSVLVTPGLLQNHWESVVNIELKRLIDSADSCIAISEKMADEYKSRYKRDFTYMHNPVDVDKWLPSSRTSWESGSVFKILYAGRAGKGITKSIKTIADSVQELRKKDLSIEFHIYTKDFARAVLVFKNMRAVHVHPPIPDYNQLPQLFSSHDLLLLPLDFNSDFFRLSMPTKVSEYMISGTPVLVFAPRDTALSEYALKYRWAYVIDNDKSSVSEAITNLYYNESVRRELGVRAKETAVLRHNAIEIRSDFRNLLSLQREIIKGNKNDNRNILSAEKVNEY